MREALLQYIWQNLLFEVRNLRSGDGHSLRIEYQGELNQGDGPDFKKAKLRIDDLWFYGDIELHVDSSLWYTHRHHEDKAYNSVILHVVTDSNTAPVKREDGTPVPTLDLRPYLTESKLFLLRRKNQENRLPCAGQLSTVNTDEIQLQFEFARKQYFDYRTNQIMQYYDSTKAPFSAWKYMTGTAIFEGFGFSNNREPMIKFGQNYLSFARDDRLPEPNKNDIFAMAGLNEDKNTGRSQYNWDYSSARPANQPQNRLLEAVDFVTYFWGLSQSEYLKTDIAEVWKSIMNNSKHRPGKTRSKQLWQVVWLPAVYLMGSLCGSKRLMESGYSYWSAEKGGVPQSILNEFTKAGMENISSINHPGTIYQYKHFCTPNRCTSCGIMKSILET